MNEDVSTKIGVPQTMFFSIICLACGWCFHFKYTQSTQTIIYYSNSNLISIPSQQLFQIKGWNRLRFISVYFVTRYNSCDYCTIHPFLTKTKHLIWHSGTYSSNLIDSELCSCFLRVNMNISSSKYSFSTCSSSSSLLELITC